MMQQRASSIVWGLPAQALKPRGSPYQTPIVQRAAIMTVTTMCTPGYQAAATTYPLVQLTPAVITSLPHT